MPTFEIPSQYVNKGRYNIGKETKTDVSLLLMLSTFDFPSSLCASSLVFFLLPLMYMLIP